MGDFFLLKLYLPNNLSCCFQRNSSSSDVDTSANVPQVNRCLGGRGEQDVEAEAPTSGPSRAYVRDDEVLGVARTGQDLQMDRSGAHAILQISNHTRKPSSFRGRFTSPRACVLLLSSRRRPRPHALSPRTPIGCFLTLLVPTQLPTLQLPARPAPAQAPPLPVSALPSHWPSVLGITEAPISVPSGHAACSSEMSTNGNRPGPPRSANGARVRTIKGPVSAARELPSRW